MSERAHARPHELYFNTASSTVTHRGWLVVYDTCPISSCFPAGLCRSCCCWPTHEIIGQEQWWRAQLPGVLAADWTSREQAWGLQPIVCPHTPCCTCTCLTDLSVCHKLREICQMENTLKFVLTVFFFISVLPSCLADKMVNCHSILLSNFTCLETWCRSLVTVKYLSSQVSEAAVNETVGVSTEKIKQSKNTNFGVYKLRGPKFAF